MEDDLLRTGKVILLAIVLLSLSIGLLAVSCDAEERIPVSKQITVTDMAGRRVSLTVPVKKVVLGYAKEFPSFAAVAGEDFPGKLAGWGLSRTVRNQDPYLKFKVKYPGLESIPDVGSHAQGTFSVEKVISLKPDMVIFPLWMLLNKYEGVAEDVARMEKVGIKTVFLDYWENPLENTMPSTLLLGTLLGKEKRAQEIVALYQKRINTVVRRLQKIKKPKPRVYVENGAQGPSENGWTCGNYAWGVMVVKAGGINIAEGIIKRWGPLAPEYLLKTNPDVIIIAEPKHPRSKRTDYQADSEGSRQLLKAFTGRLGWNTIGAVKSGRVYGVFDSYLIYNIYNFAVIETIAKWLYPYEFKDINPDADLREFYKKFLQMDYSYVGMVGIQD